MTQSSGIMSENLLKEDIVVSKTISDVGGFDLQLDNSGSFPVLKFRDLTEKSGIRHAISTRLGGFSEAPFCSLNLALHVGDSDEKVIKNRLKLTDFLGSTPERVVALNLAHSANVLSITDPAQCGGFYSLSNSLWNVDAVVTALPNITLFVMAADCVMTLIFDPRQRVLAVCHCGWRGAFLNVLRNTVELMQIDYGCRPCDLIVRSAPSPMGNMYELGEECVEAFRGTYSSDLAGMIFERRLVDEKFNFSTRKLLRWQCDQIGIGDYWHSNICSSSNLRFFYAHRKENRKTGRYGLFCSLI